MGLGLIGQATGMFAATNIDDMVVLTVFFGHARRNGPAVTRVIVGQYLGFVAIVTVAVIESFCATALPHNAIAYLGLLPLLRGLRMAWLARRQHGVLEPDQPIRGDIGVIEVAMTTVANGGDNIGVYVPVFAVVGTAATVDYIAVFLVAVAVWCCIGWYAATRPAVVWVLKRCGNLLLPVALVGIGVAVLIEGNAFGL